MAESWHFEQTGQTVDAEDDEGVVVMFVKPLAGAPLVKPRAMLAQVLA